MGVGFDGHRFLSLGPKEPIIFCCYSRSRYIVGLCVKYCVLHLQSEADGSANAGSDSESVHGNKVSHHNNVMMMLNSLSGCRQEVRVLSLLLAISCRHSSPLEKYEHKCVTPLPL